MAACLSVPTHVPGSLVAAPIADDDEAPAAAPAPIVAPQLPSAPLVEERTATTIRRPVLVRSGSDDPDQIPGVALAAYQRAVTVITQVDPGCGLTWTLLAAIGSIESDHGRYGGAVLGADGVSEPLVLGPVLNGRGAVAAVPDTDGGAIDGNTRWDRAVGPMQMLPSTWATVGVDADGDGERSADDIDDAALGAAVYLCGAPGDLGSKKGLREALLRYNPSAAYADAVIALEGDYRTGSAVLPGVVDTVSVRVAASPPRADHTENAEAEHDGRPKRHHKPKSHWQPKSDPGEQGTPSPSPAPEPPEQPVATPPEPPAEPTTEPSTEPTTEPSTDPEPTTRQLSGTLAACGAGAWCVGETRIDVGDADVLAAPAAADFDGDGAVETNADELAGLVGTAVTVTVSVTAEGELPVLVSIGEVGYRDPASIQGG